MKPPAALPDGPGLLIAGAHEYFVDVAAGEIRARFEKAGAEIERIDDAAVPGRLADALSTGSLFSELRLVEADVSALGGSDAPDELWDDAVAAFRKGTPAGRREAFKKVRQLVSATGARGKTNDEIASDAAKRLRRGSEADELAEILREMPDVSTDAGGALSAVTRHLENGPPGTFLLARGVDLSSSSAIGALFSARGLLQNVPGAGRERQFLLRRARELAGERGVTLGPESAERLLARCEDSPRLFSSELARLLEWASASGTLSAADVEAQVEDRRSEDVFQFLDVLGRRDLAASLGKLSRMLSGRPLRQGDRPMAPSDDPARTLLNSLGAEIRRMLLVRMRAEETGVTLPPSLTYPGYESGLHGRLAAPTAFEESALSGKPFQWFKVCERASRFSMKELVSAFSALVAIDEASKDGADLRDGLTWLVGAIIRGKAEVAWP